MNNPKTEASPGDILHGKNNRNKSQVSPHFIIYLSDGTRDDTFLGAMLTSSDRFKNISLNEKHFEKLDQAGKEWQVYYKASFISADLYHKKNDWRPFKKVGQLSKEGLQFVLDSIGSKEPIFSPLNKKTIRIDPSR